jgi:hypothetical protein
MKRFFIGVVLTLALVSQGAGAGPPQVVYDGNEHGDPPFLVEEGWTPLINGKNLDGWEYTNPKQAGWVATSGVYWGGPNAERQLVAMPTPGDRLVNTANASGRASNLFTTRKFGDVELYAEFMIPAKSNSGLFMHGLYEMQIWDSYGIKPRLDTDQTGALYHYAKGPINGIDGGLVPLVRAERPHGYWNAFHVWWQAPRFDASGKKTANAKYLRVLLNGVLIHKNQERLGPTIASMSIPEAAENPVMLQGDHGPVAFKNIYVRSLRPLPETQ